MIGLSRSSIASDAVTRLTGETAAAERVYSNRSRPTQASDTLPVLLCDVMAQAGGWKRPDCPTPAFEETSTLTIEAYVQGDTDAALSTALDIGDEIKEALLGDANWHAKFNRVEGYDIGVGWQGQGRTRLAKLVARFRVRHEVQYGVTP